MEFSVGAHADPPRAILTGSIDEKSDVALTKLRSAIGGMPRVQLDCAGITDINSTGLRLWSQFVRSFVPGTVELQNCSIFFVDYANMIHTLISGASVSSFFAPFHCPACNRASSPVLKVADLPAEGFGTQACPTCGSAMTPEVEADSYLDFLSHCKRA